MKKPFKLVMDTGKNVANVSTHQKKIWLRVLAFAKMAFLDIFGDSPYLKQLPVSITNLKGFFMLSLKSIMFYITQLAT